MSASRVATLLIFAFEFMIIAVMAILFLDALVSVLSTGDIFYSLHILGLFWTHAYGILIWTPFFFIFYPKFGYKSIFVFLFANALNEFLFVLYVFLTGGLVVTTGFVANEGFLTATFVLSLLVLRPKLDFDLLSLKLPLKDILLTGIVSDYFVAYLGHYQVPTLNDYPTFSFEVDLFHLIVFPLLIYTSLKVPTTFTTLRRVKRAA